MIAAYLRHASGIDAREEHVFIATRQGKKGFFCTIARGKIRGKLRVTSHLRGEDKNLDDAERYAYAVVRNLVNNSKFSLTYIFRPLPEWLEKRGGLETSCLLAAGRFEKELITEVVEQTDDNFPEGAYGQAARAAPDWFKAAIDGQFVVRAVNDSNTPVDGGAHVIFRFSGRRFGNPNRF